MTRTLILSLTLLGLTACGAVDEDSSADVLATYTAELDEIAELVDGYVADVAVAPDLAAVADLQTQYNTDAVHAMEEVAHVLEEIGGCSHMGDGASRVIDAQSAVVTLQRSLDDLLAEHPNHDDVADCGTNADDHAITVTDELDLMAGHGDAWGDMSCGMHEEATETHSD